MSSSSLARIIWSTKACCSHRQMSSKIKWPSIYDLPRGAGNQPHQIDQVPLNQRLDRFKNVVLPKSDQLENQLPALPTEPALFPDEPVKKRRTEANRTYDVRGPEIVHTELLHEQYAVIAEAPGFMDPRHFTTLRNIINPHITPDRFAVWRVEAPWLARTQISRGKKKGGGKGKIKKYETDIRIGRVIVEVGGKLTEIEAQSFLVNAARALPFMARFITYEELMAEEKQLARIRRDNLNPFDWDTFTKWNMQDCRTWLNRYDIAFKGKGY